jgi:hypothetical protein
VPPSPDDDPHRARPDRFIGVLDLIHATTGERERTDNMIRLFRHAAVSIAMVIVSIAMVIFAVFAAVTLAANGLHALTNPWVQIPGGTSLAAALTYITTRVSKVVRRRRAAGKAAARPPTPPSIDECHTRPRQGPTPTPAQQTTRQPEQRQRRRGSGQSPQ